MTRIEKVLSEYGKMHTKPLIVKKSRFIGCRGKTCKECWNEEVGNV